MGTARVPDTAVGVSSASVASGVFGTTRTHSLLPAMSSVTSSMGSARRSLMVNPWEWQRIAPTRTHCPSTGIGGDCPRILFVSTRPFHSSRLWPNSTALSIHGRRLAASGCLKYWTGRLPSRWAFVTARSMSRAVDEGSAMRGAVICPSAAICCTSSRMLFAPAPEAAWYVMLDSHSTWPPLKSPASAMSIRLTVQFGPA